MTVILSENDLYNMPLDELHKLQRDVEKAINGYDRRRREAALAELAMVAKGHGYTLAELIPGMKEIKVKAEVVARYRDPETGAKWSGRGRRPGWVLSALDAGKTLASLEI